MKRFNLKFQPKHFWEQFEDNYSCGSVFVGQKLLKAKAISNSLSKIETTEEFIELIKTFNGFFSIVCKRRNKLFAAVDRVRSFPLFFGVKTGKLFLSDDACWIHKCIENNLRDKIAEHEFMLTGYVTMGQTLYKDVTQLQAGELFVASIELILL